MAGYNWRAGKSNNAVAAEAEGLVVKSKLTAAWLQAHGIEEKVGFIKFLIQAGKICPTEWHHTSKFFNRTDYYSAEESIETLELMEKSEHLHIWRDMFQVGKICLATRSRSINAPRPELFLQPTFILHRK